MGQHEILNFLKENKGRWFLASEIRDRVGGAPGSIVRVLKILSDGGDIKKKPISQISIDKNRIRKSTIKAHVYRF